MIEVRAVVAACSHHAPAESIASRNPGRAARRRTNRSARSKNRPGGAPRPCRQSLIASTIAHPMDAQVLEGTARRCATCSSRTCRRQDPRPSVLDAALDGIRMRSRYAAMSIRPAAAIPPAGPGSRGSGGSRPCRGGPWGSCRRWRSLRRDPGVDQEVATELLAGLGERPSVTNRLPSRTRTLVASASGGAARRRGTAPPRRGPARAARTRGNSPPLAVAQGLLVAVDQQHVSHRSTSRHARRS